MKRLLTIFLVAVIIGSTFSALSSTIHCSVRMLNAEADEAWPGTDVNSDGNIDVYDAVEYMRLHYVGYDAISDTYQWSFTDPYDSAMANRVIQDSLSVQGIRNQYKDATVANIVGKAIGLKDLDGVVHPIANVQDAASWVIGMIMRDKTYIMSILHGPLEWIVNNHPEILSVDEASLFSSDLADYMLQIGEEWLQKLSITEWNVARKLQFDSSLSDKLSVYAGRIKLVFQLGAIVDASIKHVLIMWEIMKSDAIMAMVKTHEYGVQICKWIVEVVGKFIADALSDAVAAKAAAMLMVGAGLATANPAIAVGVGVVGYFVISATVSDLLEATFNWVEDMATTRIEVLRRLNPLYKYINLKFTNDANRPIRPMKVKITIADKDGDYIIPWGDGKPGEDVEILVQNTGVYDINFRVTPSVIPTDWQIDDKDWLRDYIEFPLKVGETKSAVFLVTSYTREFDLWGWQYVVHQGANPGVFKFKCEHDERLDWWDVGDWGNVNLFDTDPAQTFYNYVDFEVAAASSKYKYISGETSTIEVNVKSNRVFTTSFLIEVSLRDPNGAWRKYEDKIEVVPGEATLNLGASASFTVTWVVPSDALVGDYQIAVDLLTTGPFHLLYLDNLEWQTVFSVYQMRIVSPTTSDPADAGDNQAPQQITAFVSGLPSMVWIRAFLGIGDAPTFAATVGGKTAQEVSITWKFAGWGLSIIPPAQDYGGLYDLTIAVTFDDVSTFASQAKAVKYGGALPTEPMQKGLAWLSTQQYGDGSWLDNVGVTGLCTLAFLNAGYDETDATVSKAINYIHSKVHSDGSIYTSYSVYETSIAILPLVATHNEGYALIIENAKNWLVGAQQDEDFGYTPINPQYGGWTYWSTKGDPDLSNTQFALMALDAANLPKTDPTWSKAITFTQRCQNRPASNDQAWAHNTAQPSYNDGGFIYRPWGWSLAGGTLSYGSMTGAGIWGLLLSGVPKTDEKVMAALDWVTNHYTWDNNPVYGSRPYYYYLSMSKALTMYGEPVINGHDWYQELYNKIVGMQIDAGSGKGYWSSPAEDYNPILTTAYAILSLQTRAVKPPVQRLSYLTFILRSNCLIRVVDPCGNLVGYNYMTGMGEDNIPTAVYSGPFFEPQYIVIVNPKPGTYKLELLGISQGPYTLTIQGNYGEAVTDTFEYTGYIKPAELHDSDVTVTAIVGPIDVYTNPPQFEKIIDNVPPTTTLTIGNPQYTDGAGKKYITSATPLTLTAEDNVVGTGVASTQYRIYNTTSYDTGLITSNPPIEFHLTGIDDGEYSIDFYSVDNIGNIEATTTRKVILDNTPPTTIPTIGDPKYVSDKTYVTRDTPFMLTATDAGSGVQLITYRINSTSYDSGWLTYTKPFNLTSIRDGNYTIAYNSTDNVGNVEITNNLNVTLVGPDINGDGKVDGKDISEAAKAFGTIPGDKRWDPVADINFDGRVDGKDLVPIARMFGKQYP